MLTWTPCACTQVNMRIDEAGVTLASYAPRRLFQGRPQSHVAALHGHDYIQEAAEAAAMAALVPGTTASGSAEEGVALGTLQPPGAQRPAAELSGPPGLATAAAQPRSHGAHTHALFQGSVLGDIGGRVDEGPQPDAAACEEVEAEHPALAMAI